MGSSRTFAIGNEDHTLGNALRHVLMNNSKVGFAGYSVPHPSEPVVHIRVQTLSPSKKSPPLELEQERQLTAMEALRDASLTLQDTCDFLLEELEKVLPELKEDRIKMDQLAESNYFIEEEEEEVGSHGDEGGDFDEQYDMETY